MRDAAAPEPTPGSKIATVVRVTSGNFLEMFDFFLFGIYAPHIARVFFPTASEFASLMLAFVPGHAAIGIAAPLLVLVGRLLQGFSAGVELGGVSVYLAEIATPGRKGFYVSWQSASQQVAIIVAAAMGYALQTGMAPATLAAWGWRIPFYVGCLIVPVIFVIRRSLQETPAFLAQRHHPTLREVLRSLVEHGFVIAGGTLLVVMTTVSFYLITVYTPTFGKNVLKLGASDSLLVTACVGLSNLFWLPVMGALSD